MNENYNQVPNNGQPQYDYNNNYNNVAYNDNNGYHEEKSTGKNIFIIVLGIIIIILIILLLLKFCGSGGRLTGIKIGDVPIIYVGEKEEVPVSALGTGKRDETKFNFSLKNENIATLEDETQTGRDVEAVIKGKAPGDTTLTVTAELGNKHVGPEKATVVVCGRLEVGDITDNTITVQRGKKKSLKLDLGTDDRCYAALKFDFEDEGIARVTDDYEIEGLEAGQTTLTVSDGGSNSVEYDVVVSDPNAKVFATGINLNAKSITVCVGKTKTLKATISPSNASDKSVMWSSNKTSVATVSNGRVTGHKVGTAQVTVMTQDGSDKTATANVKVTKCTTPPKPPTPQKEVKVTKITPNPTSVTVYVGSTATVVGGITPTNATNQTVKCTSSNTAVFTVKASGKNCIITGVKAGSGTLTITANDGSGVKATVPVTVKSSSGGGSGGGGGTSCTPTSIDPNCTKCSGTKCTECKTNYTVSAGKCCKTVSGCVTYNSSCACTACKEGFVVKNGSCVQGATGTGQCWCCGGSQGCLYQWSADGSSPAAICTKANKTQAQCTGSTADEAKTYNCSSSNFSNPAKACTDNGYKYISSNCEMYYTANKGLCRNDHGTYWTQSTETGVNVGSSCTIQFCIAANLNKTIITSCTKSYRGIISCKK